MAITRIDLPIDENKIRELTVGDEVGLYGTIITGRDGAHKLMHEAIHAMQHGDPAQMAALDWLKPILLGSFIYHCGPVMVRETVGGIERWACRGAGPTTSSREEPYQWEVMRDHGIRGVIGKGGMGPKTLAGCVTYGCVYLHAIGGAAQVCAERITRVDGVDWMDLGSPEAIWHLWVERFPCIVTMDSHGNSLHQQVRETSTAALAGLQA